MRRKHSSDYTAEEEKLRKFLEGKVHVVGLPQVLQAIKDLHGSILLREEFDGMIPVDEDGNFQKTDAADVHDCQFRIQTTFGNFNGVVTTKIYRPLPSGGEIDSFTFETRLMDYGGDLKQKRNKEFNKLFKDTSKYDENQDLAWALHKHIVTKNHADFLIGSYM